MLESETQDCCSNPTQDVTLGVKEVKSDMDNNSAKHEISITYCVP